MKPEEAKAYAWQHADRNPDGSVVEKSLVEVLASVIDFDEEKERIGHAQRMIARDKRPGQTAAEGAVCFPGLEPYGYEPRRLVADDDGNLIENERARMKFKAAEAQRAQEAAEKATSRASREQREHAHFSAWADEQYAAGRDPAEITWDTCVRETGLWKDADANGPSDEDDEGEAVS